ncbi:hypothetical protein FNV43_RR03952 [Rhamnella rubrinervis]|uniref:Phytocyanin domain-containing protein n=1 Tax=Rhamnella rubrinervis TaxID=2594499 RepID=A0A8K0HIP2_9ROSA|nr:hypothetical protein FNV43_RR03952 [Rhamnella rubrinervis]
MFQIQFPLKDFPLLFMVIENIFVYPSGQDSVLLVNKDDYANCNTDKPIEKYTDGHTVFQLKKSGPYYFISGNKDNCHNNEKLVVIVLAQRSNHYSNETNAPAPPPSSTNETTPSPAPSGESPPAGSVNINPTPAPESEQIPPPPSGASSLFMSFIGCIGAFATSTSLLLVF